MPKFPVQPILGIFAKWPRPGRVKTRLAELRGPTWAAKVAQAFLLDTLDRCVAVSARKVVAFTPEESQDDFARSIPPGYDFCPQGDGELGQRMERFFAQHPGLVVVLGADSPTLPLDYVEQAFNLLHTNQIVLGPATDGGYYLLGMSQYCPELFRDIPWSTSQVLEVTVARAVDTRRSLALLPPWYDVDTPADWDLLRGHIGAMKAAGLDPGAPRTEKMLAAEFHQES